MFSFYFAIVNIIIRNYYTTRTFLFLHPVKTLEFIKNIMYHENYPSILVTFWKETDHFGGKNGTFKSSEAF